MMKPYLREQARELRRKGLSVNEIVKLTGAAKGSVSVWVRDVELSEDQRSQLNQQRHRITAEDGYAERNRAYHLELRKCYQQAGRERAKEKSWLHSAGCLLYWAEGAKSRNKVYFVNSDPNMLLLFMRFLREEMKIEDSIISIYIHCHTHDADEIRRIERYWLMLLKLPESSLRKTQIKKGSTSRRNILENGVCGIQISRTELAQHIYGAIQEYVGFENPDWLFADHK